MQKLKYDHGSIFVSVIVLTLVMSISILSLIQVSGSLSGSEQIALEDSKAYYSVETGLYSATTYARKLSPYDFAHQNKNEIKISEKINNYTILCTLNTISPSRLLISGTTAEPVLHQNYRIQLSWEVKASVSQFAFLFGNENPDNCPGIPPITPSKLDDWDGWGSNQKFVGRFHMNSAIKICSPTHYPVFKNGLVTCSDGTFPQNNKYSIRANPLIETLIPNKAGYLNNFDRGIYIPPWRIPDFGKIHTLLRDNVFMDQFLSNQPQIVLPNQMSDNVLSSVTPSDVIILPRSSAPAGTNLGEESEDFRPTLVFNRDKASYHYYKGGWRDIQYDFYDGKIFSCSTHVNILGVVEGATTVVATKGNSIAIVADNQNPDRGSNYPGLVYRDFSVINGAGNLSDGDNILGIVSGKNILYLPWWKDYTTHSLVNRHCRDYLAAKHFMFVTAAIVALDDPNACSYFCLDSASAHYYRIFSFGSVATKTFRQEGLTVAGKLMGQVDSAVYSYDKRLETDIQYPGEQLLGNINGLLMFIYSYQSQKILL